VTCARVFAARWDAEHRDATRARRRRYLAKLRADRTAVAASESARAFDTALTHWKALWEQEPSAKGDDLDNLWTDLDTTCRDLCDAAFAATAGLSGPARVAALEEYIERIQAV
jgi:hypothetical protein